MPSEADTCRTYVVPKLYAAGWTDDQIREQVSFTDGRVFVVGGVPRRGRQRRADYVLRYRRDLPIAVVEAKATHLIPAQGLQQAKGYAEVLGLSFAYSTNGKGIVEHDYTTGFDTPLDAFPSPEELWQRWRRHHGFENEASARRLLTPYFHATSRTARYYQEVAINRSVEAFVRGQRRVLLTMATGTGKTYVAFQICWRLWNARWNRRGDDRRPRILYLADRNILVDDPKDKEFAPFGDARHKIEGEAQFSREIYFATYQAIARDERRPGIYRDFDPGFFDLVIVDECHRGSARDDSNWREILEYFEPAYQLGMTATPLRDDNRDTYAYFERPLYTYSLKQGIEDGFLAPYRVHRVVTEVDATGYRPETGERDLYDQPIPDRVYTTPDFERVLSHQGRTKAIARHLTDTLKKTDRFAKTIVFCVDQDHAEAMRMEVNNLNADLARKHPDYVCRVTADEGSIGRGHLSRFQDPERETPVILTTSQLLTTGVDAPMVRNVAIARVVNSMTEFKQIIGRGTRLRADEGKYFFTILDYTGSATTLFADPDFDGDPVVVTEERTDAHGEVQASKTEVPTSDDAVVIDIPELPAGGDELPEDQPGRRLFINGGQVRIAADVVYELDDEGNKLRVVALTDYAREKVRQLFPTAATLRAKWAHAEGRSEVIEALASRGIDLARLREAATQPDADPFDLLCFVVYSSPLRTRRERADRLRKEQRDFFERFTPEAREVLDRILDKYTDHGVEQVADPRVLQVPPISEMGTLLEIAGRFGGPERLREALEELQSRLYAA